MLNSSPETHRKITFRLMAIGFSGWVIGVVRRSFPDNPYLNFFLVKDILLPLLTILWIAGFLISFPLLLLRDYQKKKGVWYFIVRCSLYGLLLFGVMSELFLVLLFFHVIKIGS